MKIIKQIGLVILLLLFIVLFVLTYPFVLIFNLIAYPFRRAKYKKSSFYKDFNIKYSSRVINSMGYYIYDYVKKNPSLEYIKLDDTSFYLKGGDKIAVTFPYAGVTFKDNEWMYADEDDNNSFTDYGLLNAVKEDYADLIRNIDSYQIKLIANHDNFASNEFFEQARKDSLFIIVNNIEDCEKINL